MDSDEIKPLSHTDFFTGEEIYSTHFFQKQVGDKWLLFNSSKEQISDLLFDEVNFEINDFKWARSVHQGKHGIINCHGNIVVDFKYDYVGYYMEEYKSPPEAPQPFQYSAVDYIEVGIEEKRGAIDKNGNTVVEIKWDEVDLGHFEPDFAVRNGKYWGVIDINGNIKLPFIFEYDCFWTRDGDYIWTRKDSKYGIMAVGGEILFPPIFEDLWHPRGSKALNIRTRIVISNHKMGLMDMNYKMLAPCKYDSIFFSDKGLAGFSLNGKTGYLDADGNEIYAPPLY